jgi:hypothetical protein
LSGQSVSAPSGSVLSGQSVSAPSGSVLSGQSVSAPNQKFADKARKERTMFWNKVKAAVKKTVEVVEKIDSSLEKAERKCLKGKSIDEAIHYEEYSEKAADAMLHPVETVKSIKVKETVSTISKKVDEKVITPVCVKIVVLCQTEAAWKFYRKVNPIVLKIEEKAKAIVNAVVSRLSGMFGASKKTIEDEKEWQEGVAEWQKAEWLEQFSE